MPKPVHQDNDPILSEKAVTNDNSLDEDKVIYTYTYVWLIFTDLLILLINLELNAW